MNEAGTSAGKEYENWSTVKKPDSEDIRKIDHKKEGLEAARLCAEAINDLYDLQRFLWANSLPSIDLEKIAKQLRDPEEEGSFETIRAAREEIIKALNAFEEETKSIRVDREGEMDRYDKLKDRVKTALITIDAYLISRLSLMQ